jgi:deoxycytidylate deaminase
MDDYNLPGYFYLAKRYRNKSNHKRPMGAVLAMRNQPVAAGFNKRKTHPIFANGTEVFSIHAEMDALIHCKSEFKGDTVWVYREAAGKPAMAKPCKYCLKHLIEIGIRTIYYTIPREPWYERIDL